MNNDHFKLCADDFGMSADINEAIIMLTQKNKLSAVSCMTNYPYWKQGATALREQKHIELGLHFNIESAKLPILIIRAYLRLLNKKAIRKHLDNQYQGFIDGIGQAPDFIDGHQHIHQLPVIRNILLDFIKEKKLTSTCWVRSTKNRQKSLKAKIINLLGGKHLDTQLKKNGINHNTDFSGIYSFHTSKDYANHLDHFINTVLTNGLIMCHPGKIDSFRRDEFNALMRNKKAPTTK